MKNKILFLGLFAISGFVTAGPLKTNGVEHTLTIIQRPDGLFDVTCLDGTLEVKSKADVLANRVCTHLRSYSSRWRLQQPAAGFCDLDLTVVRNDNAIVKLDAAPVPPCATTKSSTQQCNGLTCSLNMNAKFHDFDFTRGGRLTVTRLEDNVAAVYVGYAGGGVNGGGRGTARLAEIGGVPGILQNTIDNGITWKSVCDDSFDARAAAVACRELGYSGQNQVFKTSLYAGGDRDYGWDDVRCDGDEEALADCDHSRWGYHNCEDGEHVQLTCDP